MPRFVFDDRHPCAVTEPYMRILREAAEGAGFDVTDVREGTRPRRRDVVVTNEVLCTVRYLVRGYLHHAVWIQGIVPEESYLRRRSGLRRAVLSFIERLVLQRAELLFFVSAEMLAHYEEKYGLALADKCVIMPCFSETAVCPTAFSPEKYTVETFAYVGSLAAWQCFPETAAFYAAYERAVGGRAKLFVFTDEKEKARRILEQSGAINYEISYQEGQALLTALSGIKYGFALRRVNAVNRVATPVKLSTYAACGLIPLYSPVLADFAGQAERLDFGIAVSAENVMGGVLRLAAARKRVDRDEIRAKCERLFAAYYDCARYRREIAAHLLARYGDAPHGVLSAKKRLLFVVGSLRMGGIANALASLLREIAAEYEISLLVMDGGWTSSIPASVRRLTPPGLLRAAETPLSSLKTLSFPARIFRVLGAAFAKLFGKRLPFAAACRCHRLTESFDAAVSFCQPSPSRSFCNISNEFVLYGCEAARKLTFLHGDFLNYGGNTAQNRRLYRRFDHICAVSDSTACRFLSVMPALADRVSVVRNQIDASRIFSMAAASAELAVRMRPAIISVCRLAPEKGLLRCVPIFRALAARGFAFEWHLLGDGPCRAELETATVQAGLSERIFLHGEVQNPYAYMARADFLLLPSYHEAAPLVLEEAVLLGLPVLATDTCSARAIVGDGGVICGADDAPLAAALEAFLTEKTYLRLCKTADKERMLARYEERNARAAEAFRLAVAGEKDAKRFMNSLQMQDFIE